MTKRDPDQLEKDVEFTRQLGLRFTRQAEIAEAAVRRRNEPTNKASDEKQVRQDHDRQETGTGTEKNVVPGQ